MKTRIRIEIEGEIYTAFIQLPEIVKPVTGFCEAPKEIYPSEGTKITILETY